MLRPWCWDSGQEKGMTEAEMVGWRHRLNGHEFWWTPGVGDGQGSLVCYSSWGWTQLKSWTWLSNWTEILGRKSMTNLDNLLKAETSLCWKVHIVKVIVFPLVMHRYESWTIKQVYVQEKECFWTVGLEKTLQSPLDCKEIKSVNPKGNQPWIFIGRTDVEAETPMLWPPDMKSWLIRKDPDAEKEWRQGKGMTEDEMAGWHHWFSGH